MVLKNIFAEEQKMTLEEAILKSEGMSKNLYLWIVHENVLAVDVPEGHTFEGIGVTWKHLAKTYGVTADFHPADDKGNIMRNLNDDGGKFASLEALRNAFPKLFEVTGNFRPIC